MWPYARRAPGNCPVGPCVKTALHMTNSVSRRLYVCYVDRCLSFCIFFWPLCCLFFYIRILITSLVSSNSSLNPCLLRGSCRLTFSLLFFFFWPLYCLFFFYIRILITSLVSSNSSLNPCCWDVRGVQSLAYCSFSFDHCIVCSSSITSLISSDFS
jgi:hypothetical protein